MFSEDPAHLVDAIDDVIASVAKLPEPVAEMFAVENDPIKTNLVDDTTSGYKIKCDDVGRNTVHWVLHIPAGHKIAEQVAKLYNLDHLGEVIPETNLFHLQISSRGRKRSLILEDLSEAFDTNSHVASHEVQDRILCRSFRPNRMSTV